MTPESFEKIPPARERWIIDTLDGEASARFLGLRFEEVRLDYARLRLPNRPELLQGGGVVHGGFVASAMDSVVVAAALSAADERPRRLATVDFHVHFLDAVVHEDVVCEARIRRRGRSVLFAEIEAWAGGREVAHGETSWRVAHGNPARPGETEG